MRIEYWAPRRSIEHSFRRNIRSIGKERKGGKCGRSCIFSSVLISTHGGRRLRHSHYSQCWQQYAVLREIIILSVLNWIPLSRGSISGLTTRHTILTVFGSIIQIGWVKCPGRVRSFSAHAPCPVLPSVRATLLSPILRQSLYYGLFIR